MNRIWSYLIMAFCMSMTSARVMDFPGNRNGFQDNLDFGVKDEKVWTPPTTSGLIIDYNGYPGNSNSKAGASRISPVSEKRIENFSSDDLPPLFNEVLTTLLEHNKASNGYDIVPFSKEDIVKMEYSPLCKMMCQSGVEKLPCRCE